MAPDFILIGQTTVVAGYSVAGERIFVIGPGLPSSGLAAR
jgi:hypothetical protein